MHELAYQQFAALEAEHWWFRGRRETFARALAAYAPQTRPLKIVDLGCGVGGMLSELSRYGPPIAVDLSLTCIAQCAKRSAGGGVVADAGCVPFQSGRFDLVTLFDTLEHLEDDQEGAREAYRILREGGVAIVTVPAYQFLYSNNDLVSGHYRRYTKRALVRTLGDAGFEILHASYYNVTLLPFIIPALLAVKLKERLRPVPVEQMKTNLSYRPPPWVNETLTRLLSAEAALVERYELPFGHSILAVARRPVAPDAR